jgi:DNA-binding NtrC family response regulator
MTRHSRTIKPAPVQPSKPEPKSMEELATDEIEALAHETVIRGLKLKDARDIFEAVYMANALSVAGGSKTKAAEIAGIQREHVSRIAKIRNERAGIQEK